MAGPNSRKRNLQDSGSKPKSQRPNKKQKKQAEYHSDSDEEGSNPDFKPVSLLDSDNEDLDNIAVDDVPSASEPDSGSDSEMDQEAPTALIRNKKRKALGKGTPSDTSDSAAESGRDSGEDDEDEDEDGDSDADTTATSTARNRSKRNDPSAFATSISKILSTKLSSGRRADPVLARSADAHQAAREAVDSALEAKARKQLREQKRLASEKGRVRDVLTGGGWGTEQGGKGGCVADVQAAERRLRKVAHRGVIVLFRAVREAQERAAQTEREARKEGVFGVKSREEKVSEMSRQGFLDLIASGGGKLKKGGLEEA
ncbi:hypothetical protein DL766_008006 [Monosporascus sp. MC13-8B]|uniref:Rrp15p-domain-containing protein n=1 Tax=Monosporascus cannonballus TaxID=155416 RepID=A0ABY0H1C1_9PEZI|nr:hypothetical protein DL762_008222 [Monosporascus cannonballus]RYO96988.1 hypothetical protein DL763_002925 [Monosporascus cannonballus]RYP21152.1 hypothetical protein DL766_008006 [Monosporascus sp. MC13-8B]